jgi:hypothetical protein
MEKEQELTLDHLMRVRGDTEFAGKKFYLRTLSVAQDENRMAYALARSRRLRSALRDEGSDVYGLHIAPLLSETDEEIRERATNFERNRLIRESLDKVHLDHEARLPEDAQASDLVEQKEQREKDSLELREKRDTYVNEGVKAYEEGLASSPISELRDEVAKRQVDFLIDQEYSKAWNDCTLFEGIYTDAKCTKRFFTNSDELREIPSSFKSHLNLAYREIDKFSYDVDALKNLRNGQQ